MDMRIVFMGTPEFAVASLDQLIKNNFQIVAVVTAPDKPAGRGQELSQSAVKKYAIQHQLKVLQPEKLKDESFIKELKELNADLQIVVAFRMLPESVWNMPKLGTYNLHASLLPKYRGAAPINWAIINGEKESGVTTFKLVHEIDAGNILFQKKVTIDGSTNAGQLHDILMAEGAELIVKTVKEIQSSISTGSKLKFITQDADLICHAPKLFKETCKLNWDHSAPSIHNLIRGLSPYPAAYAEMLNTKGEVQQLKLYESNYKIQQHNETNGSLYTDGKTFLGIYCKDGLLELLDLQLQGKKRMKVQEFLRGFRIKKGIKLLN